MQTQTSSVQTVNSVWTILKITYAIVPIVAGLDKFTNLLTNWEKYLSPTMAGMLPFSAHTFMMIVGVIEIIAGIIVFVKPRFGGFIVMAWLVCIAINLIMAGFYDVAVRDLVMAIGAMSMARLTGYRS
jgi:hypothetical protein